MPWTVADVSKYNTRLMPARKQQWVSIANHALAQCMKKGGSPTCEADAIRIANNAVRESLIKTLEANHTLSEAVYLTGVIFHDIPIKTRPSG